jgi:hypothetical protein
MKKRLDTVAFQRKVREDLGKKYATDRKAFLRELEQRYRHLKRGKVLSQEDGD